MAESKRAGRSRMTRRSSVGVAAVAGLLGLGGGALGAVQFFGVQGANESGAALACPGGMSRLGHVLNEDASIFPGDPKTRIQIVATVARDGYLVEKLTLGSHTGTHLDAPGHFIEGGRTVDELTATELVWPVYVLDVTERMAAAQAAGQPVDFQLSVADVTAAVGSWGGIEAGGIVVLRTGFEDKFGTEAYHDPIPGFSGAAVAYLFGQGITAIGTDNFGPDASSDPNYDATYTALDLDGIVVPDIDNASLLQTGDIMIASPVALENGSAFLVDPLACHGHTNGN